jgi:predicted secreted Zn-dependent protease
MPPWRFARVVNAAMNLKQIVVTAVALLALGGAAVGVFTLGGDESASQTRVAAGNPTPLPATALPLAAPTDVPALPTPLDAPTQALPDRTTCDEIRGTPYRSTSERDFYTKNCVHEPDPTAQAPALNSPVVAADTSVGCETSIEITTTRTDKTYDIAGTDLDEIAASLEANAPQTASGTAYGLTEYSSSLNGSFCSAPGSCSLGKISITSDVTVTLPNLTTFDELSSDVAQVWSAYSEQVAVHEGRHVRILEEGLDDIKRQLLTIGHEPDCTALNHEIDKIWDLGGSQIEARQRAFHIADAQGRGGLIVQ